MSNYFAKVWSKLYSVCLQVIYFRQVKLKQIKYFWQINGSFSGSLRRIKATDSWHSYLKFNYCFRFKVSQLAGNTIPFVMILL